MDALADGQTTKASLRASVVARRRARSDHDRTESAHAIAEHLLAAAVSQTHTVAAYLSMDSEPGTAPLLAGLLARGTRVLVPVVEADHRLAWVEYDASARAESFKRSVSPPCSRKSSAF